MHRSNYFMSSYPHVKPGLSHNKWHHVAYSFDYETGKDYLWIDGNKVAENNAGSFEQLTQHDVLIGNRLHGERR